MGLLLLLLDVVVLCREAEALVRVQIGQLGHPVVVIIACPGDVTAKVALMLLLLGLMMILVVVAQRAHSTASTPTCATTCVVSFHDSVSACCSCGGACR